MKTIWTALAFALVCTGAFSESLAITGSVASPLQLSLTDLKALPPATVTWSYTTRKHGDQKGTFTGPLLWTLLSKASVQDKDAKTHLRHVIMVSGSDGYTVALAIGEIDPSYEGKSVLVAYEKDGQPLDGLKLVVPGDREGGRAVSDIAKIDVQ